MLNFLVAVEAFSMLGAGIKHVQHVRGIVWEPPHQFKASVQRILGAAANMGALNQDSDVSRIRAFDKAIEQQIQSQAASTEIEARLKYNEWAAPDTPQMEAAIFAGRGETVPTIEPNVTDAEWYRGDYSEDSGNALERLSFTSNQTGPKPEQIAEEKKKEQEAIARLTPLVTADEQEADAYYQKDFPRDLNNDLDAWTAQRNFNMSAASATTP